MLSFVICLNTTLSSPSSSVFSSLPLSSFLSPSLSHQLRGSLSHMTPLQTPVSSTLAAWSCITLLSCWRFLSIVVIPYPSIRSKFSLVNSMSPFCSTMSSLHSLVSSLCSTLSSFHTTVSPFCSADSCLSSEAIHPMMSSSVNVIAWATDSNLASYNYYE